MARRKIEYSKEELERFTNFIIVIADKSIDTSVINIDEATKYTKQHNRPSIIITSSETYSNIEKISYTLIMNMTNPLFKRVETNSSGYEKVYDVILNRYKNGLLIADKNTITNKIASKLASNEKCGIDFLVYRDSIIDITPEEKKRVNFLRIHKNDQFSFNPEVIKLLSKDFGETNAFGISLAQFISNSQYDIFTAYINEKAELFAVNGINEDVIDNEPYSRQLAYFTYYCLRSHKIYGISEGKFDAYTKGLCDHLFIKYDQDVLDGLRKEFLPNQENKTQ